MTVKRYLVESINGAPAVPLKLTQLSYPSDNRLYAWLQARSGYWERLGFTMLHAAGALTVTGYRAETGERVVVSVNEVE